ncbi:MAG: hypothetical protein GXP47_00215 [Acidobacteria bacterium]|nr:hypothetical protein [Acidobacteriota bacterium]
MKRFITIVAAIALVFGVSTAAYANMCARDNVPAATILYPFVHYNYTDTNVNTLFSVTNVSSEAVIVHFTLWTDYSLHVVDWNVVLSGYDVQTFSVRDILDIPGILPSTGTQAGDYEWANPDQGDGIGPISDFLNPSEPTSALSARCNPTMDAYPSFPAFPQQFKDFMKGLLTASQTVARWHIDCNGNDVTYGDWFEARTTNDNTWMYITADVVWTCNRMMPDAVSFYWQDGAVLNGGMNPALQQAMYDNVLVGDIFYINDAQNFSEAIPAVSIEADRYYPFRDALDGDPLTFYHQYVENTGAGYSITSGDYREPLPTAWAFRFLNMGSVMSTNLRVFKRAVHVGTGTHAFLIWDNFNDADAVTPAAPTFIAADDTVPYSLFIWNEDEDAMLITDVRPPWSPSPGTCRINLLPLETQEVSITEFGVTFDSGWGLLVYPPSNAQPSGDWYQVYVSTQHAAAGRYSAVLEGWVLGNANCYPEQTLPDLWSASVGQGE